MLLTNKIYEGNLFMRYSKHLTYAERMFLRARLNRVRHITLDPDGPGVVRIHLVPCHKPDRETPFTAILNGQDILPLNVSWAILLTNFIEALKPYTGKEIRPEEWSAINAQAVVATRKIYRKTEYAQIESDLKTLVDCLCTIARGGEPPLSIEPVSLADYAPRMAAPHRMDLMVSSMVKDGAWHCNQKCLHCYAATQPLSAVPELDTEGRLITLEYPGFFLVTCYTPNAQRELTRLPYRMAWEDDIREYLLELDAKKPVVYCGDLNVAHREIDIKNPGPNRRNPGFTDEEPFSAQSVQTHSSKLVTSTIRAILEDL